MNESALTRTLAECTEQVLEEMFFVQPVEDGAEPDGGSGPQMMAEVAFAGEPSGRLTLSVSAPVARSIAADFLAEDEPVLSEQEVGEVLCELANIICGSVLTRVESSTLFRLDSPRLISESERSVSHSGAIRSLNLPNGTLTVTLDTDSYVSE